MTTQESYEYIGGLPLTPDWALTRMGAFIIAQQPIIKAKVPEHLRDNQFVCAARDQERWNERHGIDTTAGMMSLMQCATHIARVEVIRARAKNEGVSPSSITRQPVLETPEVFAMLSEDVWSTIADKYLTSPYGKQVE
jgi:hypothetical protein